MSTEIATAAVSVAAMVSSVIAAWRTSVHHDKVARDEERRRIMEMENRLLAKLARNAAVHWAEIRERSVKLDHVEVKVTVTPAPSPRRASPPGTAVTRLLRASWLSTLSKRHYLETIADTQRDHHDALKRGDFAEAAALKRDLNLLVLKVSLQLLWETAKTVMGVAKVIKFFISLAG